MLDTSFFGKMKKQFLSKDSERRELIKDAGDILHMAKRSIFSLHREDLPKAKELLDTAIAKLKKLEKRVTKHPELKEEGSLRAAQEELVEAHVFYNMVHGKKAGAIQGVDIPHHVYLAGLLDVPGELVRYAVREATAHRHEAVEKAQRALEHIMDFAVDINFTGYLRTKYDQAKQMMKKMEEIAYDVSGKEKR